MSQSQEQRGISSLHADITQAAKKTALLDDLSKLQILVDAVKKAEYDADVFTQTACDNIEAIKNGLLKTKSSAWYPSLAMFRVGVEECSWLASGVQQSRLGATVSMDMEARVKGIVGRIFEDTERQGCVSGQKWFGGFCVAYF